MTITQHQKITLRITRRKLIDVRLAQAVMRSHRSQVLDRHAQLTNLERHTHRLRAGLAATRNEAIEWQAIAGRFLHIANTGLKRLREWRILLDNRANEIDAKVEHIDRLRDQIDDLRKHSVTMYGEIEGLRTYIDELQTECGDKDTQIHALNDQLNALRLETVVPQPIPNADYYTSLNRPILEAIASVDRRLALLTEKGGVGNDALMAGGEDDQRIQAGNGEKGYTCVLNVIQRLDPNHEILEAIAVLNTQAAPVHSYLRMLTLHQYVLRQIKLSIPRVNALAARPNILLNAVAINRSGTPAKSPPTSPELAPLLLPSLGSKDFGCAWPLAPPEALGLSPEWNAKLHLFVFQAPLKFDLSKAQDVKLHFGTSKLQNANVTATVTEIGDWQYWALGGQRYEQCVLWSPLHCRDSSYSKHGM